jgi:hypothetical protein
VGAGRKPGKELRAVPHHFFTLSPDETVIVISISGDRTEAEAEAAIRDFLKFYADHPIERVLFDTVKAHAASYTMADLVDHARMMGRLIKPCKVAILARSMDCPFGRIWRKGLASSGHDAYIFDHLGEAEAWLKNEEDEDAVYVY